MYFIKNTGGVLMFVLTSLYVGAQQTYRTEALRDDIKSLEVKVDGERLSVPCVTQGTDGHIAIVFDALHRTGGRFAYSVIHCDAEWRRSSLIPIEYMKGFQFVTIDDFANSFNTTTSYTNFRLVFPNEDVQLTASGNYAVQVYEEGRPEAIVLTACFSVVEPLVDIEASASGNTDIDFNKGHQQLDFAIIPKAIEIAYPQRDLKVAVCQNGSHNDVRTGFQPLSVHNRQLLYSHNRALIFEAGNEYRRIEFLTHRYNGMGVEHTGYYNPYYHVTLYPDARRTGKPYLYDQDQNGRFFVNCTPCQDADTDADYYVVHFSLMSEQMADGNLYIYGDLFNKIVDDRSRMDYNADRGAYEKAVLLKQGQYNYQYVWVEDGAGDGAGHISFDRTEGNFSETENEYVIAVYYRPSGARYDRLVGYRRISSNHGLLP